MTMAAATHTHAVARETDPVLAAFRRARLRPPPPEEERMRLIALANEPSGPSLTTAEWLERVARLRTDAE